MERNFTDENMEEFLKQSADGLRMRPSAKVWRGISSHLNRRRRRFGFLLGTSLLLTTSLGYYLVNESSNNFHNNATINSSKSNSGATSNQSSSFVSKSNKQLIAASNPLKTSNRAIEARLVQDQQFTFAQFLLQKNEEAAQNSFTPTVVDSYFDNALVRENNATTQRTDATDPLSIESVVNSYQPKNKKLTWQFYFTPTVSYRKLSDNTIANIMPHKPAFGFELGLTSKYPLSKNVNLRAGLQFNVNRYEIKTWDSYNQTATVRLVDRNGVDYVRTQTNYNNFSGYKISWLQNLYLQLSAPVGVEVKVAGDDKVQVGLASTLQPTYLLSDKTYLLSADYKNYAEMPTLVRRWNVNTSLETFVAYSTGHLNWQVGPQVRYQILSSYLKKYPLKENLFDFGLRVGISVNK